MKTPLVTVLFPVYNAEEYLHEALASICNQTYRNLEILAIDDGSSDSSGNILAGFVDDRIRPVKNEQNLGLIGTLNKGIPMAKGKYIVRADADDICLPERVERQVQFMEEHPDVGISGTGFGSFGENMPLTERGHFHSSHFEIQFRHLYQIHLMHGTSIWRTEVFIKHNLRFDPSFAHAEDYDLFDRAGQFSELSNIPDVLYHIRYHEGSVSQQFQKTQQTNSTRVKTRGFSRLGIEVNEQQLEQFRDLCHHDYKKLLNHESAVADLVSEMITANYRTNYFPEKFLKSRLRELWIGLLLCNARNGLLSSLSNHPIWKQIPVGAKTNVKLKIKSLLG